ncbi:Anaphase-promoting complex subunit 2 [Terramyces sp. JEL0728]|nr:Anaphase-promoting complex subunit 2 [Terramyces sp. JEL0728]
MLQYLDGFAEFMFNGDEDYQFHLNGISDICAKLSGLDIVEVLERPFITQIEMAIENLVTENSEFTTESLSSILEFLCSKIMPIITAIHGMVSKEAISWKYRLESFVYRLVGMNLSGFIFEIVRDYPDSLPSLDNLRQCLERSGEYHDLKSSINCAIRDRLLIIDARTQDILDIYLATRHSLEVLKLQEPVKLEILYPIKETRDDSSRKIILRILENSDPENDEPIAENDVETLIDIFPTKSVFAKEYQSILCEQLTHLSGYDIRQVEMLKSRFGDVEMSQVSVMMKDVADSRRIFNHYSTKAQAEFTRVDSKMPAAIAEQIATYEKAFEETKASRKLNWIPTAGVVDLEVQGETGPVNLKATPLQATVLLIFQQVDEIELSEVEIQTNFPVKLIVEAVQFWKTHNILDLIGNIIVSLQSIPKARLNALLNVNGEFAPDHSVLPQYTEQSDLIWPMVQGMLTNLGPSTTAAIHQTLEMFNSEIFQYNLTETELQSVLEFMVGQEKLDIEVIMMVGSRVMMPKKARHLSLKRIVDICKLTQAEFYRTASTVDYDTQVMVPMGATAADLRIEYSFKPFVDLSTTAEAIKYAINYRYNIRDSTAPLWRIDIVGPPEMVEGITLAGDSPETLPNFYVYFSFHHCLGDGLSAFSYAKEVFRNFHVSNLNLPDLHLDSLAVTPSPPPLLDNLIKANFVEIIPAAIDMLSSQAKKQREKKHQLKQFADPIPDQEHISDLRRLVFDEQYSEDLRKNCRDNGTTVAAALIVAALAAVRTVFAPRAEKKGKPLPKYQSWVVTSSMRHLLPNSSLLQGSDKETDPGTKEFGGYGGSISDEKFKFTEKSDIWERCKKVKKHLNSSFFPSMRRMKLMNYVYRKPKLWNSLQKKVDLEAITRTYAVEMANLGAWEYPCAPLDAPETEERVKMDDFYGGQNNSFKGCRAFFSVAVVSIGNVMSVLVTFDQAIITQSEGDVFMQSFEKVLNQLRERKDNFTLGDLQ